MTIKSDPLWSAMHDLPLAQLRRNHRNLLLQASRVKRQDQVDDLMALADRLSQIIKERTDEWLKRV